MNCISKLITGINEFKAEIITTSIKCKNRIDDVKAERYENEIRRMDLKADIHKKKLHVTQQYKFKSNYYKYKMIAIISMVVSTILSIMGMTGATSINALFKNAQNITYMVLMAFLQFIVLSVSFNQHYIKEKFNNSYDKIILIQAIVLLISIVSNAIFMLKFTKPEHIQNYVFAISIAIVLDVVALSFAELSNDCKYLNFSLNGEHETAKNTGIIKMLKYVVFADMTEKLRRSYTEKLERNLGRKLDENQEETNLKKKPIAV